jgi:hypothetical protein
MVINAPIRSLSSPLVELHIEELVLHGFAQNDRLRIGAAIERELRRLMVAENLEALPNTSIELGRVDAGTFQLDANPTPRTVGQRVAQHIYAQLAPTWNASAPQQAPKEGRAAQ